MNYIVMDLEWNQSAYGKEYAIDGMPFEIIQIGAVKLDEQLNIVDEWQRFIKPTVYTKLQHTVKHILGITEKDLENGDSFKEAVEDFLKWIGDDYIFCTWGSLDICELRRNMNFFEIEDKFPMPMLFMDLQKMYSIQFSDGKTRIKLISAVEECGIRKDDVFHNAFGDARYTALVMQKMDIASVGKFLSVDTYLIPSNRKEEIHLNFGSYEKYISKAFSTRERAISDKIVRSCKCIECQKPMRRNIKWFATNSKTYYGLFTCEEHGLIKGKFKVKADDFNNYYVVKILKKTDEEGASVIYEKQLKERESRRRRRQAERSARLTHQ